MQASSNGDHETDAFRRERVFAVGRFRSDMQQRISETQAQLSSIQHVLSQKPFSHLRVDDLALDDPTALVERSVRAIMHENYWRKVPRRRRRTQSDRLRLQHDPSAVFASIVGMDNLVHFDTITNKLALSEYTDVQKKKLMEKYGEIGSNFLTPTTDHQAILNDIVDGKPIIGGQLEKSAEDDTSITRVRSPDNQSPRRDHLPALISCTSELVTRDPDASIAITFRFFHPEKQSRYQDLVFLGSHTLDDVRRYVYCLGSIGLPTLRDPCFFFVENVFYIANDFGKDYARPIIDWSKNPRLSSSDSFHNTYRAATLQNRKLIHPCVSPESRDISVRLSEIPLRLQEPYCFGHLGACEHVFLVSDVRVLSSEEIAENPSFPMMPFLARPIKRLCRICDLFGATLVCMGDPLSQEHPSFYCHLCYEELFSDQDARERPDCTEEYIHE